ncbi:hypothetical protein QR680_018955 [Steinernema hermaphroditum]|uniref:Uncharacterized protein n=1 Tax=Steinernema hermaphroditum TaxID=289476 RepID=A0AA39HKH8_9BILA|nr:hypothetical protein QR680_018955 [Steinernema hermaphroditum]
MDQVPFNFIDSVVGLFASESLSKLAGRFHYAIWGTVLKEHSQKRQSYFVDIYVTGKQVHCDITSKDGRLSRQEPLEFDCRYTRFIGICSSRRPHEAESRPSTLTFRKDQMGSLSELFLRYTDERHCRYMGLDEEFNTAFVKYALRKATFQHLSLYYCGQSSEDFLKDHIDNSPHWRILSLDGKWPDSIVPYIMKACLSERYCDISLIKLRFSEQRLISDKDIFELLRRWRAGEKFQCRCKPGQATYAISWALYENPFGKARYLRDERRKSLVHFQEMKHSGIYLDFTVCSCDTSKECAFKDHYPKLHVF